MDITFETRRGRACAKRCRPLLIRVAAAYVVALLAGLVMVHARMPFALGWRGQVVERAKASAILEADRAGHRTRAALLDCASNTRLVSARRGAYYVSVLGLQLVPYVLAGAAGLMMGRARREARRTHQSEGLALLQVAIQRPRRR